MIRALITAAAVLLLPALAHAQQFTIAEQKIAICTVEATRLQQQVADLQAQLATLRKPDPPKDEPK